MGMSQGELKRKTGGEVVKNMKASPFQLVSPPPSPPIKGKEI